MKRLSDFIKEDESKAKKEALRLGLKYKGFGNWVDPATGQTYRTVEDQLVPVEGEDSADMADVGADIGKEPRTSGITPGNVPKNVQNVLKAPDPGEAKSPGLIGWYAGPDGDTLVGDNPTNLGTPDDSFERKRNNPNWVAGPEGSNFTNVDTGKVVSGEWPAWKPMVGESLNEINADWPGKSQGKPLIPDSAPPVPDSENPAKQRMKKIMGKKPASERTNREAQSALNKMRANPDQQTVFGRQLASMMKIANRPAAPDPFATYPQPPDTLDIERNERMR